MVERKEISRRLFMQGTAALGAAAVLGLMHERTSSGTDQARRLDGQLRDSNLYNVVIRGYEDPKTGKYYEPTFRNVPSIAGAELSPEEVAEKGYGEGRAQGHLVYGDPADGKVIKREKVLFGDGHEQTYAGWIKLEEGVYVSENFVGRKSKVRNASSR